MAAEFLLVLFLKAEVEVRGRHDALLLFFRERAAKLAGRTHPKRTWFDDGTFGNQGPGGNDGVVPDARAVQDYGPHADEAAVLNDAAMQVDGVSDGDTIADYDRLVQPAVQHRTILNAAVGTYVNAVDVAA